MTSTFSLMLGQRRGRWPNIKPTLARQFTFAEKKGRLIYIYCMKSRAYVYKPGCFT